MMNVSGKIMQYMVKKSYNSTKHICICFMTKAIVFVLLISHFGHGEIIAQSLSCQFTIEASEISPYVMPSASAMGIEGLYGEIVTAALKKAGLDSRFIVEWLPWKRAQMYVMEKTDTLIFPLTRTADRESQFKWVSLIEQVPCYAMAIDPDIAIDTLSDLKNNVRIGALRGSPAETEVRKILRSPDALEDVTNENQNCLKLSANRIQVWATQEPVAVWLFRQHGKDATKLRKGYVFFTHQAWIATNLRTKDSDINILRKAFADFAQTPEYLAIFDKYGVTVPTVSK